MKKGASPLRIPPRNSPGKMFLESGGSNADSLDTNARDHSFLRPPLCPIPEANYNLPINPEQDLSTPRLKSDSTVGFNPRVRLFASGSGQSLSQSVDYKIPGSNFSTPDGNLADNCNGFSNTKNRFGWQEAKGISSSVTDMDFSRLSSSLVKFPSIGTSQEMRLSHDSAVNLMGNSENVPGTPNEIARSLKYNMSVSSSSESLPAVPVAEIQNIATAKSLQLESKQNFKQLHFELREDPSFWDDHNVQVVIRIRPLSGIEIASQGHSRCVRQDSAHTLTWLGHPESRFTFDLVAGENISQEKLFKVAGLPMVENCIRGYNSCMFAYGQTGSGKTHTMLGDIEDAEQNLSMNRGMTPRVFEHLFTRICKEEHVRRDEKLRFICKCSFLEIYNEQVADLLETSSTNLQMREDARKGVYVENLTEVEVKGVNDVIRLLLQGASNRKVAATNMNRASSRSHSVFTCVIESKWESQSVTHHRFGRLNLVDLAGSERQKSSGAEGERLKEATNINKSLSTLGLVIMNLVNTANGKPQHVPYRDSKLTFLLQDSLGGNSKTIIIANVSPSNCCAMETLSTLKFAQRAKFIRNNATVNENATGDVITLKMQIQQLKEEVNHLRGKLRGVPEPSQEDYYGNVSLLGSPGSYALETGALESPLFGHKKAPRRRDLESALAGALKREQDTETAMKAMAAELEQLKLLVKQREEDAQCGKMMLRFREDKIKRLEAVACDKMSAEAYLLEERNMLMEELQMLRNRLERHPEVTRFAMENIRLLEQLRRFQEFYEGGEQARMEEQIAILRDQLLEALDWKLMHEQDPNLASQKESVELEHSSTNEEIEILHRQVDKHRREAEALRNNLSFCLEAKEKLERRIDDLMTQIDKMKSSDSIREVVTDTSKEDSNLQEDETIMEGLSAQRELKDLVEAISAASQVEAEAQGTAIIIATEAENLRGKLKESVEDNERLIYMYEKVVQERDEIRKSEKNAWEAHEKLQEHVFFLKNHVEELQKQIEGQRYAGKNDEYTNNWPHEINLMISEEETSNTHLRKELEDLQIKLQDTSEENERLLELYEKAMQERDDIRRMWQNCGGKGFSGEHSAEALAQAVPGSLETVIVEGNQQKFQKHGSVKGDSEEEKEVIYSRKEFEETQMKLNDLLEENERLIDIYEKAMQEKDEIRRLWQDSLKTKASSKFLANQICGVEPQDKAKEADQLESVCQSLADESTCLILSSKEPMVGKEFGTSNVHAMGGFQSSVQVKQDTWSIEEKLKVLREHEHQVQNKFEEMDAKLNFCGQSLDNLIMIKEKIEIDLELVTKQSAELIFSITEKEKALQAMQLEHEQLDMRLQESLKNIDDLMHLTNVEKSKWAEKEAQLQMDKYPMMANMANREKDLQELAFAKSKLVVAQDRVKEITQHIDSMSMLEKSYKDMQDHGQNIESLKQEIACKKEEIDTLEKYINEMQANRTRVYNKLRALKTVLSDLSASEWYWKSRESRAFAKIETLASLLKEKSCKLCDLKTNKMGLEDALKKTVEMEAVAQTEVCRLKDKLQLAEKQRVDVEKTVVQLDKQAALLPELRSSADNISMHFGKAASLLKDEEERIKLFTDFKNFTEQVKEHRETIKKLEAKLKLADSTTQQMQSEMSVESAALKEAELALQRTLSEKQILIESQEEGRQELDSLILELQSSEFEVTSKEEELMHRKEDLQNLINKLAELENIVIVNEQLEPAQCFLLPQVLAKLQDVHSYVQEVDASLESLQIAQNGASRISEGQNL